MEKDIKISIICNTYNHGAFIRDALEGFVMQKTNFPFEILIHDDASTDNTQEIIREYEEKYPELIKPVYQTENQYSQNTPINITFQYPRVKGKYVATCEGDDYWTDPEKLQKQYDFLESNPDYSMCVCSTKWFNMYTGRIDKMGATAEDKDITLEDIILPQHGRPFQFATILIKSELLINMPQWRLLFPVGDLPLIINAGLHGKIRMLSDCMAVYRYNAKGSWTVRMNNDQKRAEISRKTIAAFEHLNEVTEGKHSDIINKRIINTKYTLALMTHDLKALKSEELKPVFQKRGFLLRMSDVFRCRFPKVYKAMRKVTQRIVK